MCVIWDVGFGADLTDVKVAGKYLQGFRARIICLC